MSPLAQYRDIFRQLDPRLAQWHDELMATVTDLQTKLGTSAPVKIDTIQPLAPSQPPAVAIAVQGTASVGFQVQITNPQDVQPASMALRRARILKGPNAPLTPILHNIQSANDTNFNSTSDVTDYGISAQTTLTVNASGQTRYWRIRSSFDGKNWNPWQIFSGPAGPIAVVV